MTKHSVVKNGAVFLVALFSLTFLSAQDFSGYILYDYKYIDSLGQDITDEMGEKLGLKQHYYINGTDYVVFDHHDNMQQLYNSKDNKYYFPFKGEVKVVSGDLAYPNSPKIIESSHKATILGHECSSFVFETATNTTTYYYSDDFSVDPDVFSGHRFGNWATYLQSSNGGLALKIVIEKDHYTQILEAVKIEEQTIDQSKFDVASYESK